MQPGDDAPTLHAIVLAAGAASRFGSPKQLAQLNGRPLLQTIVGRTVEAVGNGVFVVLGAHAAQITPMLRHSPATVLINTHWPEGMASSIRTGVLRLPVSCDGVLLVLADQAGVSAEDLKRLANIWRRQPHHIVAAQYGATVGAPAIFPRAHFSSLLELRGDRGAQALLRSAAHVVRVPLAGAAVDVDTPEDLAALNRSPAG